jgi:hypothetical protein
MHEHEFDLLNQSNLSFKNWLQNKTALDSKKAAIQDTLKRQTSEFINYNQIKN